MNALSYAIKFWSKGAKKAFFLRHEGYLGSVGAFLRTQPMRGWGRRYSVGEVDGDGQKDGGSRGLERSDKTEDMKETKKQVTEEV